MTRPGDENETAPLASSAPETQPPVAAPLPAVEPNPFAAPVRAPRERWINPAKRRSAAVLAVIAAIVLLGAGVLIGLAAGGHGHHRHGPVRMRVDHGSAPWAPGGVNRGDNDQQQGHYPATAPGRNGGPFPGRPFGRPAGTSTTPAPTASTTAPSATPTSSHR